MKVKKFYPENLKEVNSWLEERKLPILYETFLPVTGFLVENTAVGFLYKTDSSLCWMEWIVTNPKSEKEARDVALDLVIESLLLEAKAWGAKAVFTSLNHPKLMERYKKHGFQVSDTNVTHFIKGVE